MLLEGENPRLIDEWQLAPVLWDAVRVSVDLRKEKGLPCGVRACCLSIKSWELLQIVDERGCTAPFVYNRSSSS